MVRLSNGHIQAACRHAYSPGLTGFENGYAEGLAALDRKQYVLPVLQPDYFPRQRHGNGRGEPCNRTARRKADRRPDLRHTQRGRPFGIARQLDLGRCYRIDCRSGGDFSGLFVLCRLISRKCLDTSRSPRNQVEPVRLLAVLTYPHRHMCLRWRRPNRQILRWPQLDGPVRPFPPVRQAARR